MLNEHTQTQTAQCTMRLSVTVTPPVADTELLREKKGRRATTVTELHRPASEQHTTTTANIRSENTTTENLLKVKLTQRG